MGVINSKMGVTAQIFARAPRAVSFMLTYSEISAGALDNYKLFGCSWVSDIILSYSHTLILSNCPTFRGTILIFSSKFTAVPRFFTAFLYTSLPLNLIILTVSWNS